MRATHFYLLKADAIYTFRLSLRLYQNMNQDAALPPACMHACMQARARKL